MRLIKLSVALPVLALVSANIDHHHRRGGHGGHGELVARQRSSGVLGPLLGGDEDLSVSLSRISMRDVNDRKTSDRLLTRSDHHYVRALYNHSGGSYASTNLDLDPR